MDHLDGKPRSPVAECSGTGILLPKDSLRDYQRSVGELFNLLHLLRFVISTIWRGHCLGWPALSGCGKDSTYYFRFPYPWIRQKVLRIVRLFPVYVGVVISGPVPLNHPKRRNISVLCYKKHGQKRSKFSIKYIIVLKAYLF